MISPMMQDISERCIMLTRTISGDGMGGYTTAWNDGISFDVWFELDTSTTGMIAEKQGVTSLYTFYVAREIPMQPLDVFRRVSDNAVFRVTSDGTDKKTPPSAMLNMRQFRAERWVIPS